MTYATLMVHLELGQTNAGILQIAGDMAELFHSRVVAGGRQFTPASREVTIGERSRVVQ